MWCLADLKEVRYEEIAHHLRRDAISGGAAGRVQWSRAQLVGWGGRQRVLLIQFTHSGPVVGRHRPSLNPDREHRDDDVA
jgi:hypothetical protein